MVTLNTQPIQQFISAHQLKRVDGNMLFNAAISFYTGDMLRTINSPVQVIVLPNQTALYILEFLKEEYNITEVYSTAHYYFSCTYSKALEIREKNADGSLIISILPLQ